MPDIGIASLLAKFPCAGGNVKDCDVLQEAIRMNHNIGVLIVERLPALLVEAVVESVAQAGRLLKTFLLDGRA